MGYNISETELQFCDNKLQLIITFSIQNVQPVYMYDTTNFRWKLKIVNL